MMMGGMSPMMGGMAPMMGANPMAAAMGGCTGGR